MNTGEGVPMASISSGDSSMRVGLQVLHRRWWILVLTIVLASGAAAGASLVMRPVYQASATLIADKNPPVVLLTGTGRAGSGLFEQQPVSEAPDVATLVELVKSRAVREAAARRLSSTLDAARADTALRQVLVSRVGDTDVVQVSVQDSDPHVAATAADAVAAAAVDMDLEARRRFATTARRFIGEQLGAAEQRLRADETAMVAFRDQNHEVSLSDQTQLNLRKLADLEQQRFEVQLAEQALRESPSDPGGTVTPPPGTIQQVPVDPVVAGLRTQLAALQVELAGLRKQFTPVYPVVIATQAKIQETQRRITAELAQRQAALADRESELSRAINGIDDQLRSVPTLEATLAGLTRDTQAAERDYTLLFERYREAQIAEGSVGSAVRIVDVAKVPETPVRPKRELDTVLGAMFGLFVGVLGVVAVEQIDGSVKSPGEVERLLGVPVLALVSELDMRNRDDKHRRQKAKQSLDLRSSTVEIFRLLRTRILRIMHDSTVHCVLVTSVAPQEGKSVVAAHLAVAIATLGLRVWLVDCNPRHPTLGSFFPEADSPGLFAFLGGEETIDSVVRETAYPGLQCVLAGPVAPNSAEQLGASTMLQFLSQARERADVVVLDGPAFQHNADAEILGPLADVTVVVAQSKRTNRDALASTCVDLQRSGGRVAGVVLNRAANR